MGRPTKYNQEVADRICKDISEGTTLSEICREEDMPNRSTVYDWMKEDDEFNQRIARARESGFDAIADECLQIADHTADDTIETDFGPQPDKEWIMRSKLRVETRLKLLSKWYPKKYGDKIEVENTFGKGELPPWMKHSQGEDERPNE